MFEKGNPSHPDKLCDRIAGKRANSKQDYTDIFEQIGTIREEKQELLLEDSNTQASGGTSTKSKLF